MSKTSRVINCRPVRSLGKRTPDDQDRHAPFDLFMIDESLSPPAGTASGLSGRLRLPLAAALERAAARPAGGLASLSLAVPEAAGLAGCAVSPEGFTWSRPSRNFDLAGAGIAKAVTAAGSGRFVTLAAAHADLVANWDHEGPEGAPDGRIAFAGFSFDPDEEPGADWHGLPNAGLTVPAVLLLRRHGHAWLTFSTVTGEAAARPQVLEGWLAQATGLVERTTDQVPQRDAAPVLLETAAAEAGWRRRLDEALGAIHSGKLQKIVLTRRVRYATSRPVDCARVFRALEAGHPECAGYAVTQPGFALLGVSPERLVSIEDGTVTVDALAGTAPRHPDPAADAELARQMLDDSKIREEHALVRDRIVEALGPACTDLVAPSEPGVMRLPRVQHLWSPVRGYLRAGQNILTLTGRLHPTPAVGGSPAESALEWLSERETGRGWYTGACGWLGAEGDGELVVVLRCGVINDRTVDLFAGAGIVAGSIPERELAETEWKLMTMRGALQFG